MKNTAIAFIMFLSILLLPLVGKSALIVDQSFSSGGGLLFSSLVSGSAYTGQTVTVGISGDLVAVEFNAKRREDFLIPWILDIQDVSDSGFPTGSVLTSEIIQPEDFDTYPVTTPAPIPMPVKVDFSNPVNFSVGDQFAIVLHAEGVTGSPGLYAGDWAGGYGNPYPGGALFSGPQADQLIIKSDYDLHFRSIMDSTPVPIPTAMFLLGSGLICLVGLRRKSKKN